MRITTTRLSTFLPRREQGSMDNQFHQLHNREINQVLGKKMFNDLDKGTYKLSSTGNVITANQEARILFSSISQSETKSQDYKFGGAYPHFRQLLKDSEAVLADTKQIDIDLDSEIPPEDVAENVERLTLLLADGDKEKLDQLKQAYFRATSTFKNGLSFEDGMYKDDIDRLVVSKFEALEGSEEIAKIDTGAFTPTDYSSKELKELYIHTLEGPFNRREPEISYTITKMRKYDIKDPSRYCPEEVTKRLMNLSREILDQGLATVDELRSAYAYGYKEESNTTMRYRVQEVTYQEVMKGFDQLEKEYA